MNKEEEEKQKNQIKVLKQQIDSIRQEIKDVNQTLNKVITKKLKEQSMSEKQEYPIDLVQYSKLLNAKIKVNNKIISIQKTQLMNLRIKEKQCEKNDHFVEYEDKIEKARKQIGLIRKQAHEKGVNVFRNQNVILSLQNSHQYGKIRALHSKLQKKYRQNQQNIEKLNYREQQLRQKQRQQNERLKKYEKHSKLFCSQRIRKKKQLLNNRCIDMENKKRSMCIIIEKRIKKMKKQIDEIKKNIEFQNTMIQKCQNNCEWEEKLTKQLMQKLQNNDKRLKFFNDKFQKLPRIQNDKNFTQNMEISKQTYKKDHNKQLNKLQTTNKSRYSSIEDQVNLSTTKFRISRRNSNLSSYRKQQSTNYKTLILQKDLNQ